MRAVILSIIGIIAAAAGFLLLPSLLNVADLFDATVFLIMGILALSLAFVWGYAGINCFGQAAFFGLGAYSYAIAAINLDSSLLSLLIGIAVPAAAAGVLGYFLFSSRIGDVYLGVLTLVVTLLLYNLASSTGGYEYKIGRAHLGGYNGIPGVPPLSIPGLSGRALGPIEQFYFVAASLVVIYAGLRLLLNTDFGRVVIGIRENELRAELLGYNVVLYKLGAFVLGGALAGFAGCLYAVWGAYVSPSVFGLAMTAQIIMWVIVGGLGTLIGPVLGAILLQFTVTKVGSQQLVNTYLILGAILITFVSFVPQGLVPILRKTLDKMAFLKQ